MVRWGVRAASFFCARLGRARLRERIALYPRLTVLRPGRTQFDPSCFHSQTWDAAAAAAVCGRCPASSASPFDGGVSCERIVNGFAADVVADDVADVVPDFVTEAS